MINSVSVVQTIIEKDKLNFHAKEIKSYDEFGKDSI